MILTLGLLVRAITTQVVSLWSGALAVLQLGVGVLFIVHARAFVSPILEYYTEKRKATRVRGGVVGSIETLVDVVNVKRFISTPSMH